MTDQSVGCLLLHGFGGRPFEMQPLADCLRGKGFEVATPTLAGHEGNRHVFDRSRFEDWYQSAEEAFVRLRSRHTKVAVVGFSMGGTLAMALAQKHALQALVCIGSPIFLCRLFPYWSPDWRLFFSGIVSRMVPVLSSSLPSAESRRIAPWEGYEGLHHSRPLHSLRMGARQVGKNLAQITVPIMIVHGEHDRAVHPDNAWIIARGVASERREVHVLPIRERITSGHLLVTHEETRDRVNSLVSRFVGEVFEND